MVGVQQAVIGPQGLDLRERSKKMTKTAAKKGVSGWRRPLAVRTEEQNDTAIVLGFNRRFRRAWNVSGVEKLRLAANAAGKDFDADSKWFENACRDRLRALNQTQTGLPMVSKDATYALECLDWMQKQNPEQRDIDPPVLGGRVVYAPPPARRRGGAEVSAIDSVENGLALCVWIAQKGAAQESLAAICPWHDVTLQALVVVDLKSAVWRGSELLNRVLEPLADVEHRRRGALTAGHIANFQAKVEWAHRQAATLHPRSDVGRTARIFLSSIIERTREAETFPRERD
jgi:hypothetical protein